MHRAPPYPSRGFCVIVISIGGSTKKMVSVSASRPERGEGGFPKKNSSVSIRVAKGSKGSSVNKNR
jgi:hypothetical protein